MTQDVNSELLNANPTPVPLSQVITLSSVSRGTPGWMLQPPMILSLTEMKTVDSEISPVRWALHEAPAGCRDRYGSGLVSALWPGRQHSMVCNIGVYAVLLRGRVSSHGVRS